MSLDPNNKLLVDALESLALLDGRFSKIKLVNWDPAMPRKRGCFSLVFRAHDQVEDKTVALKFYEISPSALSDQYRMDAFAREAGILQTLLNQKRCLQLEKGMGVFNLSVNLPAGGNIVIPCRYFAVQWLADDIDDFFLGIARNDVIDKLKLFNEILLAIEALHRREVFHRDLKADNLRSIETELQRLVIAIDLGTAARLDSKYLNVDYTTPVGAWWYAAPEAKCKLAGNRILAPYTDLYAAGCLLFELFNKDYFFRALQHANPTYDAVLAAVSSLITEKDEEKQVEQWRAALSVFGAGIAIVKIDEAGSSVPPGVADILNEIMGALTHVNYSRRPLRLEGERKKLWIAIRILENQAEYARRLAKRNEMRRKRLERIRLLDLRFKKQ